MRPVTTSLETAEVSFGREAVRGYGAWPRTAHPLPGLVLIPDVRGLGDHYRDVARRFAAEGFFTLAIDLYSREGAPKLGSPAEAMAWIATLPDPRILGDLQAAVDHLGAARPGRRVGITGFCMGGQYALLAACSLRGLSACASFYGMVRYPERNERKPRSPLDAAADLSCPYLGIFGEEDPLIPMSDVAELRERLGAAGKSFEIESYAGCGHAFLNYNRPDAYRREAAEAAFEKAVRFFSRHLPSAT